MYHIKDDKRAQTSAALIYKGLCECLKTKPFDKITITDIQKASTVGRATFYRNFDNISDVLYWQCDNKFNEVLIGYPKHSMSEAFGFVRYYFDYWMKNSEIIELLLDINRQDIIYACHMKNSYIITREYKDAMNIPTTHYNYFMAIRTGFTISMLMTWLEGGKKETTDELIKIMYTQLEFVLKNKSIL